MTILTRDEVLKTVHTWPPAERISLAEELLRSLIPDIQKTRPRRNTLKKALGLLATDAPAPSDEEIRRLLDERRMERYG